ncbi:MAG: hypothetical protein KDB53_13865 [Planctomycetes bacterium]|nr:hypothetical protein [Planctomycetota bacterium]
MDEREEDDAPEVLEENLSRFPCGHCGAQLAFEPGTTHLECSWCGHENQIERGDEVVCELDFRRTLEDLAAQQPTDEHEVVRCHACAAQIETPGEKTAFDCPWCGAIIVSQSKTMRLVRPQSILPFKVTRDDAMTAYGAWLGKRWFAPNDLANHARSESRLRGVYLPYWTFDAETTSRYTGERGEYYYVTVSYQTTGADGKPTTRTRQERRTRWYPASGVVRDAFDDILILASHSINPKRVTELTPWDLAELVPYRDDYLAGFESEAYSVDLAAAFEAARPTIDAGVRRTVCRDIAGDEQRIHDLNIRFDEITFKHLLLPIWVSAFRYRGKVFQFLVNGRTGEVQGERPFSRTKITLAVLAGLVVIGLLIWFFKTRR